VLPVPAAAELTGRGATQRAGTAVAAGAGRLVMGTLTRTGDGVHLSITLVDTALNKIIWGLQRDAREADDTALASTLAHELERHLGAPMPQWVEHVLNLTGSPAMATAPETAEAWTHSGEATSPRGCPPPLALGPLSVRGRRGGVANPRALAPVGRRALPATLKASPIA